MKPATKLLNSLLKAETIPEFKLALSTISGDFKWMPYGNTTGNKGQIKIATDPVRALVERIINSIDAVTERGLQEAGVDNNLPRTKDELETLNLHSPRHAVTNYVPERNDHILVQVSSKQGWESSDVSIWDKGIGIQPSDFFSTILSLSGSNKISKPYQVGMYGQGGASSIGRVSNDGYVLIASRPKDGPLGFTVVRYEKPSANDKRGYYVCLVDKDGAVPFADDPFAGTETPFSDEEAARKVEVPTKVSQFPQGTLVRHLGYDLSAYKRQARNPASVYRGLHTYLFGTLLPFRFRELTKSKDTESGWSFLSRPIEGTKARLNGKEAAKAEYKTESPVAVQLPHGYGQISIEYWMLVGMTKRDHGHPVIGEFVSPNRPVIFTLHGQTHGEYSLHEINSRIKPTLPYAASSLVVHVALDGLTPKGLDNLLSSGREGLVNGTVLDVIKEELTEVITTDEHLAAIDGQRMEKSLSNNHVKAVDDQQLRDNIARVVEKMSGQSLSGMMGNDKGKLRPVRVPREAPAPLPTQDPPTFVKFVADETKVHPGGRKSFRLETDAPNSYENQLVVDGGGLEIRWAHLNGGRIRISALCSEEAKIGDTGVVTVTLDGLTPTSLPYTVEAADPKTKSSTPRLVAKRLIPNFEVQWTKPDDYNWVSVLELDEADREKFAFDYRVKDGQGIVLYCSEIFPPFQQTAKSLHGNRSDIFKHHYMAEALIHAFKRADNPELTATTDEETRKSVELEERRCAATAFVMAAYRILEEEEKKLTAVASAA